MKRGGEGHQEEGGQVEEEAWLICHQGTEGPVTVSARLNVCCAEK